MWIRFFLPSKSDQTSHLENHLTLITRTLIKRLATHGCVSIFPVLVVVIGLSPKRHWVQTHIEAPLSSICKKDHFAPVFHLLQPLLYVQDSRSM